MYNLFFTLIYNQLFSGGYFVTSYQVTFGSENINFGQYLAVILALISTVVVYVCCCLIVAKIIKTVANVFRG